MARLTKFDIERKLLFGKAVEWHDIKGKKTQFVLSDAKARRLFAFLLKTKVRQPTGLEQTFINDLSAAYTGTEDPASTTVPPASSLLTSGPWRLHSIETDGFGGLNIWNGPPFHFDFEEESLLIEGQNGSGKSSLIGSIIWALSGERPRDQSDSLAHEAKPVFDKSDKKTGEWPPIACYPPSVADLNSPPHVRVMLMFNNPQGNTAKIERILDGGKVTTNIDSSFEIPSILLETGLIMPARLSVLRLDEGGGRLTDAVQKLTGLDDLVAIGALVDGLCNKGREYLSTKQKELKPVRREFDQAIKETRDILSNVQISVPDFAPSDTDDNQGKMAKFAKKLVDQAAELTQVVANDLASDLALANTDVQNQIIYAIGAAQEDLNTGLEGLQSWKDLQSIAEALDEESSKVVTTSIAIARKKGEEAVQLLEKSLKDPKFQLKAVAAQWHSKYKSDDIEVKNCPLCDRELKTIPLLAKELEKLRSAGDAAARKFDDNLNAIIIELNSSLPESLKKYSSEILSYKPQTKLVEDLRQTFMTTESYSHILVKFSELVDAAITESPRIDLAAKEEEADSEVLQKLTERIDVIERLLDLCVWFRTNSVHWSEWWQKLVTDEVAEEAADVSSPLKDISAAMKKQSESLLVHLSRLSAALAKVEPYNKAAEKMRLAWTVGKKAAKIEKELSSRVAIAESMKPLKDLVQLVESITRETIEDLSGRISAILKNLYLTDSLQYQDTQLRRKKELVVRGNFGSDIFIDATLVANTSWLRAILWSFLFALREEAVEQLKMDPFPLLLLDDPQTTFDSVHRHRWAQYIASLQNDTSSTQIILATSDELFLDLIKVDGVSGRQIMITAAGPELGHVVVFDGDSLARKWTETKAKNTLQAGRDYLNFVRIYVEGMLKIMLRGEDASISSFVLGQLRDKLTQLNNAGIAPWNRLEFKNIVNKLEKNLSTTKYIEKAHHVDGVNLGMTEACDVELYWRKKLYPALENGFYLAREYHLLHGGQKAQRLVQPSVSLPEGYQEKVKNIPIELIGRAAALTDGRAADGCFDQDVFYTNENEKVVLWGHQACRLTTPTLEPVARPGDILLMKKEKEPPEKALVVALYYDKILARRFEITENDSDIAVLTAQAISPFQIAPPVVAHKATLVLHKIIGVIYKEAAWSIPAQIEMEICDCGGEAVFTELAASTLGLIEVVGQSAEPYALNGQYLIVKKKMTTLEEIRALDGKPIIASDTDNNCYFKRLRMGMSDHIVLESLAIGGDYGPVVLSQPGQGKKCLESVWPVAGVLFELPN